MTTGITIIEAKKREKKPKYTWVDAIYNAAVTISCFVLFAQIIINALLNLKNYWILNIFILIAIFHIIGIKVSRADIQKAMNKDN